MTNPLQIVLTIGLLAGGVICGWLGHGLHMERTHDCLPHDPTQCEDDELRP